MSGFDIQGFDEQGDAIWSVGVESWVEAMAYLARSRPLDDDRLPVAVLIRRGPQIHAPGGCAFIGPYRLVAAECWHCRSEAGAR